MILSFAIMTSLLGLKIALQRAGYLSRFFSGPENRTALWL
jgi:hypothetical protein